MRKFDIVIPMYNEVGRIETTLYELRDFKREFPQYVGKIILVDDGSTDRTVEWCRKFRNGLNAEILCMPKNGGKWKAIREGLHHVKGRVLILDADCGNTIYNVLEVDDDADLVFGTRFDKRSIVTGKDLFRTTISQGYRVYVQLMYCWAGGKDRLRVQDLQCPFKMFDVRALNLGDLNVDRFAGDVELLLHLSERYDACQNLPIFFHHSRGSKVRPASVIEMAKDTFVVANKYRKHRKDADRKVY